MLELSLLQLKRLGFNKTWIIWIHGCLVSSLVSILVNGSPLKEFMLQIRLRQGDSLVPFLFTIVEKGLTGLMREAVAKNLYRGLKVGG